MIRFIGKRILQMIPVVLLVATLIFGILYLVPGDPAQIMLGSTASEYELAEMREQLGLNRPFIVQLGEFLSDVFLHFDLGESYLTGAPVAGEIMQRLPRTLILGIASMVLAFGIGIPLGVTAAVHQNGWGDRISMIIALLGVGSIMCFRQFHFVSVVLPLRHDRRDQVCLRSSVRIMLSQRVQRD